jgi:hypothetical protein
MQFTCRTLDSFENYLSFADFGCCSNRKTLNGSASCFESSTTSRVATNFAVYTTVAKTRSNSAVDYNYAYSSMVAEWSSHVEPMVVYSAAALPTAGMWVEVYNSGAK